MREACEVALTFDPLLLDDHDAAIEFLTSDEWPYHGSTRLTADAAASVSLVGDDVVAFWVRDGDRTIGLIRAVDLSDLADGSPLLDIRIATSDRGRGVGTAAVGWLTSHLFDTYDDLRRIEAVTRGDNGAMQRVFARCGYRCEGRMVEAWVQADGSRHDALTYAVLRREWPAKPAREHGPRVYEATALQARADRPTGRAIVPPDHDPNGPAFFEWELRAQSWSDTHPHDEWVYVLEGELCVEADGRAVTGGVGTLIRVPAGARGAYRAPVHARMLSVYGPRSPLASDPRGELRDLTP